MWVPRKYSSFAFAAATEAEAAAAVADKSNVLVKIFASLPVRMSVRLPVYLTDTFCCCSFHTNKKRSFIGWGIVFFGCLCVCECKHRALHNFNLQRNKGGSGRERENEEGSVVESGDC